MVGDGSWQGISAHTGRPVEIVVAEGRIRSVRDIDGHSELPWISAGWIDLQVNGCGGADLNGEQTTPRQVVEATRYLWSRGVTYYLPTVITASFDRMSRSLAAIAEAARQDGAVASTVGGIHMEGPYLSEEFGPRGAHPADHIRDPDEAEFDRLQRAADGRIALVTLAPERRGAAAFIRHLRSRGIVASIGHCAAGIRDIAAAAEAGASMSTHLGNGAHPTLPRHPNYIWDQLADDRLHAGLIADSHHLPLSVLKSMLRAKGDRAFIVSDCVALAGMPPGVYDGGIGGAVRLAADGRLTLADHPNILAGSASTLERGIRVLVDELDYALADAIDLVTRRPAAAMGWDDVGKLEPGARAHLTLFERSERTGELLARETVVDGMTVYRADRA